MIIDEHSLELTAKALATINPIAGSAEQIRNTILAYLGDDTGYVATCGWVAFTWADDEGRKHIKVAVDPYSVTRYLNRKEGTPA